MTCRYGKVGYPSRKAALRAGTRMRRQLGPSAPMFAYECDACGCWHQTRQSPQTRRKRKKRAAQVLAASAIRTEDGR